MDRAQIKIFITLFFSIFAAVTGVGIVVPLLPVYARQLGAKGVFIGLIFGGFSLTRSFFLPWFGRLSDVKGRRPFLVVGLFSYFLVSLCFMVSSQIYALIGIRMVQGVASAMIMPVAQAYVGDITPEGKEGLTMGLFNMSVFIGLSIGPLFGGVIRDQFGLDAAFLAMGALAFAAFFMSYVFLPSTAAERLAAVGRASVRWTLLLRNRMIVSLFSFRFVYTTCIGIIWGFLPVYADAAFSLSSSAIGVLVMLGVSISGVIQIPMGMVADRYSRRWLVVTGGAVVMASMVLMGRAGGFADMFAANCLFGIGGGISMPALMALTIQQGNRIQAMGSVVALITVAHSLGMLAGSLLAGVIMDLTELRFAFYLGTLVMAAGIVQFLVGTRFAEARQQ